MTLESLNAEQKQLIEEERDKFAVEFAVWITTQHSMQHWTVPDTFVMVAENYKKLSAQELFERFKQERK